MKLERKLIIIALSSLTAYASLHLFPASIEAIYVKYIAVSAVCFILYFAALAFVRRNCDEAESKRLLYEACDRWGLPYMRSDANFVLVWAGGRRQALLDGLQARHIYIRDRDRQPGCQGCVRVTTGLVAHTRACIEAMEEILCGKA